MATVDDCRFITKTLEDSLKFTATWGNNHPGPEGNCNRVARRQCARIRESIDMLRDKYYLAEKRLP